MPHWRPSRLTNKPLKYNGLLKFPYWQRKCTPANWTHFEYDDKQTAKMGRRRSMDGTGELDVAWHLESVRVSRESASVTPSAGSFVRRDEARLAPFRGVDHDFGGPIVLARTMTGLTLNSRKSGGAGGVALQTGGRFDFDVQALGGTAVRGRLPAGVDGTMTKLAAIRADEGHLVDAQTEKTSEEDEPTGAEIIASHPFRSIRLARANRARQGIGHRCSIVGRGEHVA